MPEIKFVEESIRMINREIIECEKSHRFPEYVQELIAERTKLFARLSQLSSNWLSQALMPDFLI